ncbi:shTK domain protein [Cooperia oncophora]
MLFYVFFALILLSTLTEGAPMDSEVCKDVGPAGSCKRYKENGWCTSEDPARVSIVEYRCQKTCGFCHS